MKISNKIFLTILFAGISVLIILSLAAYSINKTMAVKLNLRHSEIHAQEFSNHINRFLSEKIKIVMMMSTSRIVTKALETSNHSYAQLSLEKRKDLKNDLNKKWCSIKNAKDQFIKDYTENEVSRLLKDKQTSIKGEFGEIFLTNKFGALVASTAKLSTFVHDQKYWWKGAYYKGKGKVFIDDRGYDDSVDGYVLGLVIPVRKDGQIIGLLKFNLNIIHSINELISNMNYDSYAEFKLVRSGGLILFEEGIEPLSSYVHDTILHKLERGDTESVIINDSDEKYLIGLSEIKLTKNDRAGYAFGGTFESVDHKKGNTGESWYVLHYSSMGMTIASSIKSFKSICITGVLLIFFLGLISYWFAQRLTKPLQTLNLATKQIGTGSFGYQVTVQKNDELGELAVSFNNMSNQLKDTTTTITALKTEINQRKIVEKELKNSERRYRQVFETNTAIKLIINPENGAIVEVNQAACEFYGYSKEEFKLLKISDINALSQEEIQKEMAKAKSEKKLAFNFPHKLASGEIREVEVYSGPVQFGENTFLHSIIQDITIRKQTEQKIKNSEEKYRTLFHKSNDGIIVHNFNGQILDINSQIKKMLGYTTDEFKQLGVKDLHPDSEIKILKKAFEQTKRKGHTKFETKFRKHDGSIIDVEVSSSIIDSDTGVVQGIVRDLTERREMEKQLQQAQKMESIGQLAGGIAHDFNNILYPIMGFTQLSKDALSKDHPVQENLSDILDGTKRASDLVKRILLFSRQKEQKQKPTTLQPIIKESYKLLRASIPANIDLTMDLYDGKDCVLCNESEIHEIILNLCTNAYHAIVKDHGKIMISLKKQSPPSALNLSTGEYLFLSVKDNGVGIPEEIKNKIFEPYVTTKDVGKGSGLGLAVIYGIVQNYKGAIHIESHSGKGAEFKIFLPITDQAITQTKKQENKDFISKKTGHILFVDDEDSIVKLGIRILENSGYTVTAKKDSREAFEYFRSYPEIFDLVITDMSMPGMVGSELSKRILKIRPEIPIIICSGYNEKLDKITDEKLKISAYLDKPLTIENLLKVVKEVLAK